MVFLLMGTKHYSFDSEFWRLMNLHWPSQGGVQKMLELTGLNVETLRRRAKERNIRSFEAAKRDLNQNTLKKDFFRILNPDNTYWLGYIWADGAIQAESKTKRPITLHLKCARKDEGHIINLRDKLGSNHEITRGLELSFGKPVEFTRVAISCTEMAEELVTLYGILPGKSKLNLPWPTWIPPQWLNHFCRGYFDGDGSAGKYSYSYQKDKYIFYWKGSEHFIRGMKDAVEIALPTLPHMDLQPDPNSLTTFILQYQAKEDIRTIYNWMYPEGNNPHLPRKRTLLESILALSGPWYGG